MISIIGFKSLVSHLVSGQLLIGHCSFRCCLLLPKSKKMTSEKNFQKKGKFQYPYRDGRTCGGGGGEEEQEEEEYEEGDTIYTIYDTQKGESRVCVT